MVLAIISTNWRAGLARWPLAVLWVVVMVLPIVLWAKTMGAYLNTFLAGSLVAKLAVWLKPPPGVAAAAAETGPDTPPGWSFNPSSWTQRAPVIILAFVGL